MSNNSRKSRPQQETKKFRNFGGGNIGVASQAYGETSSGTVLPIKVVDDGSGLGKVVLDEINHGDLSDMPDIGGRNPDHDARYYTKTELGSNSNGEGASLISIEDAMNLFTATEVETALEEIMDRITPVTYSAVSITTTQGTPTGSVSDIQTINDGNSYLVDEAIGSPGFITTITYTGISTGHEANKIQAHYSYNGNHTVTIQIEKAPFDGSAWDNVTTITNTGGVLTFLNEEIGGTITDYFNAGTTKIRWNHITSGNINHDFILDYNVIKDDSGAVSGITDHGALSGRADDDHLQYYLFRWQEITSTQTAVVGEGYLCNSGSLVTLTLPATALVGEVVRAQAVGAGGWRIAQPSGVTVNFGNMATTTGASGYLESTVQRDAIELVCTVADTGWDVVSSIGSITVV